MGNFNLLKIVKVFQYFYVWVNCYNFFLFRKETLFHLLHSVKVYEFSENRTFTFLNETK